jgi:uncharacterized membrane-anchored protein YitT (DUF2179 family)
MDKGLCYDSLGSCFNCIGICFFITPRKIVPEGIYGISIVLHHSHGTPVGLMALAFNIPLTLISIKVLGSHFGAKTVTGFCLQAGSWMVSPICMAIIRFRMTTCSFRQFLKMQ